MNISNQGQHFSLLNLQNGNKLPENSELIKSPSNESKRITTPPIKEQNDHRGFIDPIGARNEIASDAQENTIRINLRQVTFNQVREIFANENIKGANEIIGELDVMPYWESPLDQFNNSHIQSSNQYYSQQKFDLFNKIENAIDVKRNANQPTNLLEGALNKLNRFNETINSVKIDFLT